MSVWWKQLLIVIGGIIVVLKIGTSLTAQGTAQSRPDPQATGRRSEQVFKNIQALKGISVDDFMGTMGIMTASLVFDCSDCHANAGTDKVDWAADPPRKRTARRMVEMVTTINRTNFGGRQAVSCWTCHRGRDRPLLTPTMTYLYSAPPFDLDDVIAPTPA